MCYLCVMCLHLFFNSYFCHCFCVCVCVCVCVSLCACVWRSRCGGKSVSVIMRGRVSMHTLTHTHTRTHTHTHAHTRTHTRTHAHTRTHTEDPLHDSTLRDSLFSGFSSPPIPELIHSGCLSHFPPYPVNPLTPSGP